MSTRFVMSARVSVTNVAMRRAGVSTHVSRSAPLAHQTGEPHLSGVGPRP